MRLINRAGTISAGDSEQDVAYGIEFNPFMASLLSDKLYTDKPTACWRELYANAHDESADIKVQLPTHAEPTCVIWDNGTGLDQDELIGLFCMYGASNKRDTNSKIGGFGVGSKVLFSYTDTFSAVSVKDGIKTSIVCYKNDEGMPTARIVGQAESDEQSGTRIEWATTPYDATTFHASALEVFARFENKPTFLCDTVHKWDEPYLFKAEHWAVRDPKFSSSLSKSGSGVQVVMGGIAYPLSAISLNSIDYDAICQSDLDIFAPIGAVQLAASREALSYDEKTIAYLTKRLSGMKIEAKKMVEDEIASISNWYDKELARQKLISSVSFLAQRDRSSRPEEMGVYHEVKMWGSRGSHIPTRLTFDTNNNFLIDPEEWDGCRRFKMSEFQDRPLNRHGRYTPNRYDCAIRFPKGTTTPPGFMTRGAEFLRDHSLRSMIIVTDDLYDWCKKNHVPTDHVILWDKELHDTYKVDKVDAGRVDYRRKTASDVNLFRVRTSLGPSHLSLDDALNRLDRLDEDTPTWFLLANNGDYVPGDNPAVNAREPEIAYLCAMNLMSVYLVPKSYANVLGGNFMNINKEKEGFDIFLNEKLRATNMLDGYVRAHLRTEFRALSSAEMLYEHVIRSGLRDLQRQASWDAPGWFNRFAFVLLEEDNVWNAAQHLVVNKARAKARIKKELDITTQRLYRRPLIFQVLEAATKVRHGQVGDLASKVSKYLK